MVHGTGAVAGLRGTDALLTGHVAALAPAWLPGPVPAGLVRTVTVTMAGFPALTASPRVVSWDDERVTVRTPAGALLWYEDRRSIAFGDDGQIQSVVKGETPAYPRRLRRTRREWDAIAVRSMGDLMEVVDLGRLRLETQDDPIALTFPGSDDASSTVWLSAESRLVLRAHGVSGPTMWRLVVNAEELVDGDDVLCMSDL